MKRSPQDQSRPRPLARSIPPGSPRRSMSASTTRPVQHNIPLSLSIVERPHEAGLICSWRADSLCLCLAGWIPELPHVAKRLLFAADPDLSFGQLVAFSAETV